MPWVSGLFPPIEMRPEVGAALPESTPGAITSTLPGPSGSQVGSHSSSRMRAESARPPRSFHASGKGTISAVCRVMSTRIMRSPIGPDMEAPPNRKLGGARIPGRHVPGETPLGRSRAGLAARDGREDLEAVLGAQAPLEELALDLV